MSTLSNSEVCAPNASDPMTRFGPSLTKFGSVASLICAVHCALTPLAILALPVLAGRAGGATETVFGTVFASTTEWIFLGLILGLAGVGFLVTFPLHRDSRPAMLTLAGLISMVGAHLVFVEGTLWEIGGVLFGASLIAWGGFLNRSLCQCRGCHKSEPLEVPKGTEVQPAPASSVQ